MNAILLVAASWLASAEPVPAHPHIAPMPAPAHGGCATCCKPVCCCRPTLCDRIQAFRCAPGKTCCDCCGNCCCCRPSLCDRINAFCNACGTCCKPCCDCGCGH
jgi:hypothetical protein